jgi:flagellar secretion chaperone FliS
MTLVNADRARSEYLRKSVQSATPAQLVIMLFDRMLLDLARGEKAQLDGSFNEASNQLVHAQSILGELMSALDTETWDGAAQLMSVYNFAFSEMIRANIQGDPRGVRECIRMLEPIADGFRQAAEQQTVAVDERGIA